VTSDNKPLTHQADLAKLPRALAPLIERPQWAVWRWTQKADGTWQKPPFQAMQPDQHASTASPSTWAEYEVALDAVETRRADGITYMLSDSDPFAAIDLDHCRDVGTHSIDAWAQNFLDTGRASYSEVTPSGTGLRIWGLASGSKVNRKFTLEIDGKSIAAELFRRAPKALTITGLILDPAIHEFASIDKVVDWGLIWGERRKAAAQAAVTVPAGNGFNGGGSHYSVDEIDQIVRGGAPAGANRSDTFHTVIGHYLGVGWDAEQIFAHLQQFPDGIGGRYLGEGRLSGEIIRSANKYSARAGTLPRLETNGFEAKAPAPPEPDPELEEYEPSALDPELDDELDEDDLEPSTLDPELDDELSDDAPPVQDPNLPQLFMHGDPDPRPLKDWLVKYMIPVRGHGLFSGQWGTGKTFVLLELAAAIMTGQPFVGHIVKRQCGVLLIASEGADEVRLRLEALVREKCGNAERMPFAWYETAPALLQKDGAQKFIAMARRADAFLRAKCGLPLGLVIVDTLGACAGYVRVGEESDNATGQAMMDVLKAVSIAINCFVFGTAHVGKNPELGTRGGSSREDAGDVILVCLGEKTASGSVTNTRLAVRKHKAGRQGQEFPFALREVVLGLDEDGDPITTMVVDWSPAGATGGVNIADCRPPLDPWAESRRQDQKTAVLRLKRALMSVLADKGVDLAIPPDGPVARMVDQKIVREEFYSHTPADGTPEQKGEFRRQKFVRALDWAEQKQLVGIEEIDGVTYLRLSRPDLAEEDGEEPE
jgi:hypothetical protein